MIDIDHFKHFNDTFGHKIGDYVLQEISQFLRQNCRQTDLVCRYGGEEFLVILPDCQLPDATKQAEILCKKLRQLTLIPEKSANSSLKLGYLTASFGVASYPQLIKQDNELLSAADQALYLAKKQGRDRVVVYKKLL
jgi:diguanylate cyclase (GGDEF)-like protein